MAHPVQHYALYKHFVGAHGSKTVDLAAYAVAIIGNVAVVPQAVKAWQGPVPGLAISTWVMFIVMSIVWLVYAILHRQKPLIAAQTLSLTANLAVVGGWLMHQ